MKQEAITRQGIKEGKKPWGLVDFEAMRHLAPHYAGGWQGANWNALECMLDVLIFGAKKYAPNNWKNGYRITQCVDSLYRHIILTSKGERVDVETGISHYGHILCNLMFMSYWVDYKPELDDRVETVTVRDYYAPAEEPMNEGEAIEALLAVLGGFMNGVDVDPNTELPLIGYAMYFACQAYGFANVPVSTRLNTLTKPFADPIVISDIRQSFFEAREANLSNEVRKESLGFTIEPINNGNDFNVRHVGICTREVCDCGGHELCQYVNTNPVTII